jgi:hypothetical protein
MLPRPPLPQPHDSGVLTVTGDLVGLIGAANDITVAI